MYVGIVLPSLRLAVSLQVSSAAAQSPFVVHSSPVRLICGCTSRFVSLVFHLPSLRKLKTPVCFLGPDGRARDSGPPIVSTKSLGPWHSVAIGARRHGQQTLQGPRLP